MNILDLESVPKCVTFVIGLPGSGKTYFIENIINRDGFYELVIDDPTDPKLVDEGIAEGKNMIIADPWLCNPNIRQFAYDKFYNAGWFFVSTYFFENDQEKCRKNIEYRNDGRLIKNLDVFNYSIPEGVDTIPIWTPPD